jgi:hypothetical protein
MGFVWISEQTAIISLYSINWLVFITETTCVYCAVRAECLTFNNSTFCPHSVFMCFVWISEQTATFALYNIKRLFLKPRIRLFTERYGLSPCTQDTRFVFKGLIYVCFIFIDVGWRMGLTVRSIWLGAGDWRIFIPVAQRNINDSKGWATVCVIKHDRSFPLGQCSGCARCVSASLAAH